MNSVSSAPSALQRLLILATLLIIIAGGLYALLQRDSRQQVDIGAATDIGSTAGFFPAETDNEGRSFRWSGLSSQLLLHNVPDTPLLLTLHAHGDLLTQYSDPRLYLQQHGTPLATVDVVPGWRSYQLVIPAGAAVNSLGLAAPLDLTIQPYCPATSDNRILGVPLDWLTIEPLASPTTNTAPLRRTVLLTWGLVLLAGGLALRNGVAPTWRRFLLRNLLPVAGAGILLIIWAALAASSLLFVLSWFLWPLLLLTGLFLAARLWQWLRIHLPHSNSHLTMTTWPWLRGGGVLLFVIAHALLLLPTDPNLQAAGAWLVLLLPGWLLGKLVFAGERDPLLRLFLAACTALALPVPLLLALYVLPGAVPWWFPLLLCSGLSMGLVLQLARLWLRQSPNPPDYQPLRLPTRHTLILTALLVLAAFLRLSWVGGAEFQGDEARATLLAMQVQQGHDTILLLHRKGPVEVLLPAAPLLLTGTLTEWSARLPFALAGVAAVLGGYVLMRRLVGGRVGQIAALLAALFLATDGFLLAFSRIVQYQSVLVLMSLGAVWCAWRFYCGTRWPQRYLIVAAVFAAVALLAHYDGIYVLPALAGLVLIGGWANWGHTLRHWLAGLAAPVAVGALLLFSFYLPFLTHDQASGTLSYLAERVGAEQTTGLFFNNLPDHYERAIFYNTIPQILLLAGLLVGGVTVWLWRGFTVPWRWLAVLLIGLWLLATILLIVSPATLQLGDTLNWALLACGLPLGALLIAPRTPDYLRLLLLWFAPPLLAHAFLIADPRTHFYTMNTALNLLAALAAAQLFVWLGQQPRRAWLRVPLAAGGLAVFALALPYLYIVFVRQMPEYQRSFPNARPALYADLSSDQVPWDGIFGFPHRDGWKVVGNLYEQGVLQGSYFANQRNRVGIWYTRGAPRCATTPDYFFLATAGGARLTSDRRAPNDPEAFEQVSCVLSDGMRMMDIYSRIPVDGLSPLITLDDPASLAQFDARPLERFPLQHALDAPVPQHTTQHTWSTGIQLTGYDLVRPILQPGQMSGITLYWSIDAPLEVAYNLRIALYDDAGRLVATASPHCQPPAPASWVPYHLNTTTYMLQRDVMLEPGTYIIHVSLHHPQSDVPLPLHDDQTQATLTTITIDKVNETGATEARQDQPQK